MYPDAFELHGSFTCSDHCLIILCTSILPERHKALPFRYQNLWSTYHQANAIIKKNWNVKVSDTKMFQLTTKLKFVKHELKSWARNHFGNFHDKVTANENKIEYVEGKLLINPLCFRFRSWMSRLLKQREKLLLFNQKYWSNLNQKE